MKVILLNKDKSPCNMISPAYARILMKSGKVRVLRKYPFTLILQEQVNEKLKEYKIKIDPGETTGIVVLEKVNETTERVVFAEELENRGNKIKMNMEKRKNARRNRRNRKTRYRQPRFLNRKRKEGWLPPSIESRVCNIVTWVKRLIKLIPITSISLENAKFDTQALQDPEISGIEYQQGELFGYEVKEYLLEKFNHTCVYCDKTHVPLQIDHVIPRSKGGSNRVSNLVLACVSCNQKKSNMSLKDFVTDENKLKKITSQLKKPLKAATITTKVCIALQERLTQFGLPIELSTGGQTKFNRVNLGLLKAHWIDAACIGKVNKLIIKDIVPLIVKAFGHGKRQRCRTNKYGFPIKHIKCGKFSYGWRTGDIGLAIVESGKYIGKYVGRVAIRESKYFSICGISVAVKYFVKKLHMVDGYNYLCLRKGS